jgi:hypothetical protein
MNELEILIKKLEENCRKAESREIIHEGGCGSDDPRFTRTEYYIPLKDKEVVMHAYDPEEKGKPIEYYIEIHSLDGEKIISFSEEEFPKYALRILNIYDKMSDIAYNKKLKEEKMRERWKEKERLERKKEERKQIIRDIKKII